MIAKGNNYRYSDMVREILDIVTKGEVKYDWRKHRGLYATNFSEGSNGYMVNGGGDCGVYKNSEGKWSAKYYTEQEKMDTFLTSRIKFMHKHLEIIRSDYERKRNEIEELNDGDASKWRLRHWFRLEYNEKANKIKQDTKNEILKKIFTKK